MMLLDPENMMKKWVQKEVFGEITVKDTDFPHIRAIDVSSLAPENFHFTCGEGSVVISLKDGTVTFDKCNPPEAAQEFWRAVANAFPSVAEGIRAHSK